MKLASITSSYRASIITSTYSDWINKGNDVLDIGCGTGVVAEVIKDKFRLSKIAGCDLDDYLLTEINFTQMTSLTALPYTNSSFDIAMLNDVLHHTTYNNQSVLLREALRVAKTVLIFELKPTLINKIGDYVLNKIHHPTMNIPFTYRSREAWVNLFKINRIKFEDKYVNSPKLLPFKHIAFKLTK